MAENPVHVLLTENEGRKAWFTSAGGAHDQFEELAVDDQARIRQRFRLVCTAAQPLPKEKFRDLGEGIYEVKLGKPALRVLCFSEGGPSDREYFITHVIKKPKKRRLNSWIKRAKEVRTQHNETRAKEK